MLYPMPKKIQFAPSQAKWSVQSTQSVLLLIGLHELRTTAGAENSDVVKHLVELLNKAKALEIPILDIYGDDAIQGMQRLGELLSTHPQLMIAGKITPMIKQMLPHLHSVSDSICIVDDAILLANAEQHMQWVDSMTAQGLHHMNSYSLKRLWSLSAPTEQIMSNKGMLLAIAEQLDMEALEIHPTVDLRDYGLDSVAIVTLVGLWRANGANIRYEDVLEHCSLQALIPFVLQSASLSNHI